MYSSFVKGHGRLLFVQLLDELRHDVVQVCHKPDVRDLEDRCIRVLCAISTT
jgi:hypothetical protein